MAIFMGLIKMKKDKHTLEDIDYYSGPERRHAEKPRRIKNDRRYRLRSEALISEYRSDLRRKEDEEGFIEFSSLYTNHKPPT